MDTLVAIVTRCDEGRLNYEAALAAALQQEGYNPRLMSGGCRDLYNHKFDVVYISTELYPTIQLDSLRCRKVVEYRSGEDDIYLLTREVLPIEDLGLLAEWYDRDTKKFDTKAEPWNPANPRIKWLLDELTKLQPNRILDVGCGSGTVTWHLTQLPWKPLVNGIDISPEAIKLAKERCPEGDFEVGVAEKIPYHSGVFDVVCCSEVLEHVQDAKLALHELKRVARRAVLITTPTSLDDNIRHVRVFNPLVELANQDIDVFEYDAGPHNHCWCTHWKLC